MTPKLLRTVRVVMLALAGLVPGSVPWCDGSAGPLTASTKSHRALARSELPLGLGIASVAPMPGGVLQFYNPPRASQAADDAVPTESVRFAAGLPAVDIAEAPPWFEPEYVKMDYELLHLRVLTLTPDWVEVIGNSRTGQTRWVRRADVRFASWPEHYLGVAAVRIFDPKSNPVRERPLDDAPVLATTGESLPPRAVRGDWLQVSIPHLADGIPREGWVRWRRGDRLLLGYEPLS